MNTDKFSHDSFLVHIVGALSKRGNGSWDIANGLLGASIVLSAHRGNPSTICVTSTKQGKIANFIDAVSSVIPPELQVDANVFSLADLREGKYDGKVIFSKNEATLSLKKTRELNEKRIPYVGPLNPDDPVRRQPDVITLDLDKPLDVAVNSLVEFLIQQFQSSALNTLDEEVLEAVVLAEMRTVSFLKYSFDKSLLDNITLSVGGKDMSVKELPPEMRDVLLNLSIAIGKLNSPSFVGNLEGLRGFSESKNPLENTETFNLAVSLLSGCMRLDSESKVPEHTKPQATYSALLALEKETPGGHKVDDLLKKLHDENHYFAQASVYRYLNTLMEDEMVTLMRHGRYKVIDTNKSIYDPYPEITLRESSSTAEN